MRSFADRRSRTSPARADACAEGLERRTLFAVITPFAPRFSVNDTGDIAIIANTLMTAPDSDPNAANARAGIGGVVNDNDFLMTYVDVDSDATTFNSSRATLDLPAGAQILAAFLYWGGRTISPLRGNVKFAAPGAAGYTDLSGTVIGSNAAGDYHALFNVTATVQAAGEGQYTTANVQATTGADRYAGWSLVVAYRAPNSIPRNLTIFDGYAVVDATTPNVSIPVSGFTTPPGGSVNANIGVVAYEGDLGLTGDSLTLNSTTLTDARNPSTNFFNSTISTAGTHFTNKSPNYVNQLGFDADIIVADGILPNSATSATINLTTGGEFYSPGVVTTSIELYAPDFAVTKSVVDLNGGDVLPGDVLEYTVAVTNTGGDASGQTILTDPLPAFTNFVPGSLEIVSGANAGVKTDALGDDQAEFDPSSGGRMVFRMGTGANGSTGGSFAVTDSSTIRFQVTIDPATQHNAIVTSQALMTFIGVTLGGSLSRLSNQTNTPLSPANDPPVNAVPTGQSTAEDTALVFSSAGSNAVSVSDVDVNAGGTGMMRVTLAATGGLLTLAGVGGLTFTAGDGTADATMTFDGSLASVNAALDGLSYNPAPDFNGAGAVRIITSDNGNTGTGGAQGDDDTFGVAVTAVNDPPVAGDDSAATAEDQPASVPIGGNDSDVDGDPLTVSVVSVTHGTAVVDDNGTPGVFSDDRIVFTPEADYSGAATVIYSVDDGNGGTDQATVTFSVTAVADPPNPADDAAVTPMDTAVTVDVLANDTDAEGDINVAATAVLTPPANGTATVDTSTGRITYTPAAGYFGADEVVYEVRDATGLTGTATLRFTVTVPGQLAAAASDATADEDQLFSGTVATFVGPFPGTGSYTAVIDWGDGNTSPGTITAVSGGGFAVSGSHTYATGGDFPLTVTVTDASSQVATATAVVHVAAAPVVTPPPTGILTADAVLQRGPRRSRNWRLFGTIVPSGAGAHSVLIEWGDGKTTRVDLASGDVTFDVRHRYVHRNARGPVHFTVSDSSGAVGVRTLARTRHELWVMDMYRRVLGREATEAEVEKWGKKLERCRDTSATRRTIERKVRRSAAAAAEGHHAH